MLWSGWPLDRALILLVGAAYLALALQAGLFHYRQNFRNPSMWLPVAGGGLIGLAAILLALLNLTLLLPLVTALFWIGLLAGFIGFFYHFRGVGQRVEGYAFRNLLVGPPVILPLLLSILGLAGLLAVYWR